MTTDAHAATEPSLPQVTPPVADDSPAGVTLRTKIAVGLGKMAGTTASWLRLGSGSNLPGRVAMAVDKALPAMFARQLVSPVVAVTGTNGKTTTCGLLAQFLTSSGRQVLHNTLGANMLPGIMAAMVRQANWDGVLNTNATVIEVDEASLRHVTQQFSVEHILVNNLFRDQLDRYGELDTTAKLIAEGVAKTGILNNQGYLFLNADDPLVTALGKDVARPVYFGVEDVQYRYPLSPTSVVPFPKENTDCPRCGATLHIKQAWMGHLGHYECTGCAFQRPTPTVMAKSVWIEPEQSLVKVVVPSKGLRFEVTLPLPGLFNVYNLLGALSVALMLGLPVDTIQAGVKAFHSVFGRAERKTIAGKSVMVMLIKNPVGATEVLKQVAGDPKGRLLIAINDNFADGRDVSWLWDAAFEVIPQPADGSGASIVVSGERAADMAVRLKYAGIAPERLTVVDDLKTALHQAVANTQPHETLYILPTYTALLKLRFWM
jgi:UDP-N-acetylmuramyl tripeptide synthase